jgi:cell wall-associated NlpC family hydrolase
MARRGAWIGMAMAIPATVAFTASPPPNPPPPDPQAVAITQPVLAMTPVPAAPATPQTLPPGPASMPGPVRDVGSTVVNAALTKVGAPYAWAATGPDAFDCSGLVVWAFRQAGLTLPRSSEALASGGQPVAPHQMQPGDVISLFPDASHVGIYVGHGRMIHAQFEGLPVIVESLRGAPIHSVRRYS